MEVRSAQKNESLLLLPNFWGVTAGADDEGRWLGWVQGAVLQEDLASEYYFFVSAAVMVFMAEQLLAAKYKTFSTRIRKDCIVWSRDGRDGQENSTGMETDITCAYCL